jgi:hypothetical protein
VPTASTAHFEPSSYIDPLAENVAILDDNIADIDADAEFDPPIGWRVGILPNHCLLHVGRATKRIDDAGEFDQQPVTGGLDQPSAMRGDRRDDFFTADRS